MCTCKSQHITHQWYNGTPHENANAQCDVQKVSVSKRNIWSLLHTDWSTDHNSWTCCSYRYLSAPAVSHIPIMNFFPFASASLAANAAPIVCQQTISVQTTHNTTQHTRNTTQHTHCSTLRASFLSVIQQTTHSGSQTWKFNTIMSVSATILSQL